MRISYILSSLLFSAISTGLAEVPADTGELASLATGPEVAEYPFSAIIESIAGYQVLRWEGQAREALVSAGESLIAQTKASPIVSGRINEAGFAVEDLLEEALAARGLIVDTPRTQSGRRQSAGYPDLAARKDGRTFYLEVKCFSASTRHSTQRSFYLSPSDDPKVTEDAHHLLFGFELESLPEDRYRVVAVELVDLSDLTCSVKIEFNASNRDLYGDGE